MVPQTLAILKEAVILFILMIVVYNQFYEAAEAHSEGGKINR